MRWWTSDLHFGHANVIEYCKRPFKNVHEMNQLLASRWNERVKPEDDVMFLGDWCLNPKFYFWLKYLNFNHLYIVRGNHDRPSKLMAMLADDLSMQHLLGKVSVHDQMTVEIGDKKFFCVHRPLQSSDEIPTICGHVHERWLFLKPGVVIGEHSRSYDKVTKMLVQPILNVGCDVHGFYPISDEQVLEFFK
jgi:calcineurin-like phosphoesterase family protein